MGFDYNPIIMEHEIKLTPQSASRYDRGMSEAGAAVLEGNSETREIYQAWDEFVQENHGRSLDEIRQDAGTRDLYYQIREFINRKEKPFIGNASSKEEYQKAEKQKKILTSEEERRFKEIMENEELSNEAVLASTHRQLYEIEEKVKAFTEQERLEGGGDEPVPGEVLRSEKNLPYAREGASEVEQKAARKSWRKEDWSEYGWPTEKIVEVGEELIKNLHVSDDETRMLLEMFLARGRKPDELISSIKTAMAAYKRETGEEIDHSSSNENLRKKYKILTGEHDRWLDDDKKGVAISLDLPEEWVRRLVFPKALLKTGRNATGNLNIEEYDASPDTIEELAWRMMHSTSHDKWGIADKFPLLEMRIVTKMEKGHKVVDAERSKYYVNEGNMVEWVRNKMYEMYDLNPDDPHNFFEEVSLARIGYGGTLTNLMSMFANPTGGFFKSEDGETRYNDLYAQWIKEAWVLSTLLTQTAQLKKVRADGEKFKETITEMMAGSTLTKDALGKNLMSHMMLFPNEFKSSRKGEPLYSDSDVGAAYNKMYRVYDALSDFSKLQEILGQDSNFFKRETWEKGLMKILGESTKSTGEKEVQAFWGFETHEQFVKAFDKNGQITTKSNADNFVKFINFFVQKNENKKVVLPLREVMKATVAEQFHLRTKTGDEHEINLKFADLLSYGMTAPALIWARNDVYEPSVTIPGRAMNLSAYRVKVLKKGDPGGYYPGTFQEKALVTDTWRGVNTVHFTVDKEGRRHYTTAKEQFDETDIMKTAQERQLQKYRKKIEEMRRQGASEAEIEKEENGLRFLTRYFQEQYQKMTGRIAFNENALFNWANDQLGKGLDMYDHIMSAKEEFDFKNFTEHHPVQGPVFQKEVFIQDFQKKLVTPYRYLISDYGSLDYSKKDRYLDQEASLTAGEAIWRDMTLGEHMFGYDLLNSSSFWMRDKKGKVVKDVDGRIKIDYNKLNDPKHMKLLVRRAVLTELASKFVSFRSYSMTDSRYNEAYFLTVADALKTLPKDILGSEFSLGDVRLIPGYYEQEEMQWFGNITKTSLLRSTLRSALKEAFLGQRGSPDSRIGLATYLAVLGTLLKGAIQTSEGR